MNKKLFSILLAIMLLIGCIAVGVAAADGIATFEALQAAVNAYTDASEAIKLTASINGEETLKITKDVYLDLNGFDITCPINVTGGTLYCMDSQTDDFTVKDAQTGALTGYGKLTNVTGEVAGIPAETTGYGYMMIKEGSSLSFHRVGLEIHTMSLRAETVGLYYKSHFAGDELVAENVQQFGVALSVKAEPTEENLEDNCKCSVFTDFKAGKNANSEDATSTLLKNVMKTTNTSLLNHNNSRMPVYGKAYILTKEGSYLFGNLAKRSLLDQVRLVADDEFWSNLKGKEPEKADAVVSMYRQYADLMRTWKVPNIESAMVLDKADPLFTLEDGADIKVLAITSSFGLNTTQMLYDVIMAEAEARDIELGEVTVGRLYASGCTLEKHLAHAPTTDDPEAAKRLYEYSKVTGNPSKTDNPGVMQTLIKEKNDTTGAPGATLLDGLLDEDWDIIFMQQGAAQSPQLDTYLDSNGNDRITLLRNIVDHYKTNPDARFVWNMLWGYQSDSTISPFPTLFRGDQMYMYQCNIDAVMKYVVPRTDYDRIIPSGTVIQNARTSEFGDNLCRDTYHLNNYGGIMAAYGLYAVITGQELTEINIDAVAVSNTNGIGGAAKITEALTEKQKAIIMDSVNDALKTPFAVTESKYPAKDYSSYTYTENLQFIGNTKVAVCPACRAEKTWIEINQDNLDELTTKGYFGATMPRETFHFYLSEDVEYTGTSNSFLHMAASSINVCLHLNSHNLTATGCAIATVAGNAKLNIMGTGTVSGNGTLASQPFRGSTIVLNSGTSGSNLGTVRLYSGTYVQPANNTQYAPVSTALQGGLLEIYEDVTIEGKTNSLWINTSNNNAKDYSYTETVNIYGGSFKKPVICAFSNGVTTNTTLSISGGTFNEGITLDTNTVATLSGAPVIKGAGLVLSDGITVTLGALTTGADIAVNATGAFTVANTQAPDYVNYFSAVQEGFGITAQDNVLYCTEG